TGSPSSPSATPPRPRRPSRPSPAKKNEAGTPRLGWATIRRAAVPVGLLPVVAGRGTGSGLYGVSGATTGAALGEIVTAGGSGEGGAPAPGTVVSVPAGGVNVPVVDGFETPAPNQTTSKVAPGSVTGWRAMPLFWSVPCAHMAAS